MSASLSGLHARLAALTERINPVLVKEVRQALRGNYFRAIFWLTLSGALVIGLMVLVMGGDDPEARGVPFFRAIFGCMVVATHGFLPFAAFVSMGNEWEENTYDLLVLSDLRPRRIVLGKLLASGVQALLVYSAFAPFLVFAFLLGGVDLLPILIVLGVSMLVSLCLAATAIAGSSSTHGKFARVFVMASLAAILVWVTVVSFTLGVGFVEQAASISGTSLALGVAACLSLGLVYVPLPVAQTCARLAHAEENRTSFLRVHVLVMLVVVLGWGSYGLARQPDWDVTLAISLASLAFLTISALVFVPESRTLGRRARLDVPRSRALALLALPFLPGGSRALLWYLLGAGLICAWFLVALAIWPDPYRNPDFAARLVPAVAALYGWLYVAIPALLVREREDRAGVRIGIRLMGVAVAGAAFLVPSLFRFFVEPNTHDVLDHAGNPAWLIWMMLEGDMQRATTWLAALLLAGLFVLGLNARHLQHAVADTLRASATRAASGTHVAERPAEGA